MFMILIIPMRLICLTHLVGTNLTVVTWKRKNLMSGGLDCTCLMYINMPG